MTIASVLVVLQMAISLLSMASAPGVPANILQEAQSFAAQAMTLATQALEQSPDTQLGSIPSTSPVSSDVSTSGIAVNYTPPVQNTLGSGMGTVVESAPAPTSTPITSCTITGTYNGPNRDDFSKNMNEMTRVMDREMYVSFTYTLNGEPTSTPVYISGDDTPQIISPSQSNTLLRNLYVLRIGDAVCEARWANNWLSQDMMPVTSLSQGITPASGETTVGF